MVAVKLSESVIPRDDLIQELLTRLAARADMRLPVHIAPYEGGEEVLTNMDEEKQIFTDSGPIEASFPHFFTSRLPWRKKGIPLQGHVMRDIAYRAKIHHLF